MWRSLPIIIILNCIKMRTFANDDLLDYSLRDEL